MLVSISIIWSLLNQGKTLISQFLHLTSSAVCCTNISEVSPFSSMLGFSVCLSMRDLNGLLLLHYTVTAYQIVGPFILNKRICSTSLFNQVSFVFAYFKVQAGAVWGEM